MIDALENKEKGRRLLNGHQFQQAEDIFSKCCVQHPEDSDSWFSLGVCRHRQNKAESAMLAFERAIYFDSENIAAQNAKANMLVDLGRTDEALEVTLQALKIDPNNTKSLTNHASLLFQGAFFTEALNSLNHVLAIEPRDVHALENRAVVLNRLGRAEEALSDAVKLAEFLPSASPHLLQASALIALNRYEDALIAVERALFIEPEDVHSIVLSAMAKAGLERYADAEKSFLLAESLDATGLGHVLAQQVLNLPTSMRANALSLYLSLAEARINVCDWRGRTEYIDTLQAYLENVARVSDTDVLLLKASFYAGIDPLLQLQLAKCIAKNVEAQNEKFSYKVENKPERIRVGYLAKSYNKDSITCNAASIFEMHNRIEFEIFCYSMVPSDNSEVNEKIKKGCDQYIELYPRTENEVAELIHQDRIHILVDLDGIDQQCPYEILARQVAPVQIGFSGMSFSSGADFLQYHITDSHTTPATSDRFWSEKLVKLPNTHFVYESQQSSSSKLMRRSQLGLPSTGAVFCCFAKPELIEPIVFTSWLKVLECVLDSVLWLQDWGDEYRQNLQGEALEYGLNPSRLIFAPILGEKKEELARYKAADLFLDTFTINGSETVSDALWSGLPVLSLFGETMASRMTASKLSVLDFPTLICSTEEEYIERAYYLATHPEYLGIMKRKVQRHVLTKPLFKPQQTVLNLEKAFHEIWECYLQGKAPESFTIEEE